MVGWRMGNVIKQKVAGFLKRFVLDYVINNASVWSHVDVDGLSGPQCLFNVPAQPADPTTLN